MSTALLKERRHTPATSLPHQPPRRTRCMITLATATTPTSASLRASPNRVRAKMSR